MIKKQFKIISGSLIGAKVEVIKKSSSSLLTLKLVENFNAYQKGEIIHLMPYEIKEIK